MLELYKNSGAERLVLLGDILYHGPRNDLPKEYAPKEVIAMLNPLKDELLAVRGNCDTEVDQMVLEFPILADYCLLMVGQTRMYATLNGRGRADSRPHPPAGGQGDHRRGWEAYKDTQPRLRVHSQGRESGHLRAAGGRSVYDSDPGRGNCQADQPVEKE